MKGFFKISALTCLVLSFILQKHVAAQVTDLQLPTGANVVSGNVTISQEPGKLTINQTSSQAIINWDSFNLGSKASVYFNNNSTTNSTLNQILDTYKSVILGSIYSNGKLFINNPNGITIGDSANIRAHSFVASAMKIANQDFLNRNYHFTQDKTARLENSGDISAQYVALMAPEVVNKGKVTSEQGSTQLAASDNMILSINNDQSINIKVNPSKIRAKASNEGVIVAENGIVKIRADMAQDAIDATIRAPETQASGFVSANGVLKLVSNSGKIRAKEITLAAGDRGAVEVSGIIEAVSTNGIGGVVNLFGKEVIVKSGAIINASGSLQGGSIIAGGSWLNNDNNLMKAKFATIERNALLDVSSLTENAGSINISTNTAIPGSLTSVQGILYARTGSSRKKRGGEINISGDYVDVKSILVDVSSPLEIGGTIYVEAKNDVIAEKSSFVSDGYEQGGNINIVSLFGDVNLNETTIQTNSSSGRGGTVNIESQKNIVIIDANIFARGSPVGGDVLITSNSQDVNLDQTIIQTNGSNGRGGTVYIKANQDVEFLNTNILTNGETDGGQVVVVSESEDVNLNQALIQTNGSTGRGGTILISGANQTLISGTEINAKGQIQGGIIKIGYDALNHTIPFSNFTSLDNNTILNTESSIGTSSGGFIETSGHILNPLATIKAGEGGTWLLDPYNISIVDDSTTSSGTAYSASYTSAANSVIRASAINTSLNAGTSVTITTGSGGTSAGDIRVIAAISKTLGGNATLTLTAHNNIIIYKSISSSSNALNINLNSSASASTGIGTILYAGLNSNGGNITIGTSSSNGNLAVGGDITINSGAGAVTINGTVTGVAQVLYETTTTSRVSGNILYTTGFGTGGSDAAATFGSAAISRITYRMEVNYSGTIYYADVSFDAWSGAVVGSGNNGLRIPDSGNTAVLQKTVTNLVVKSNQTSGISSRASAVSTGSGKTGLLELWYWNYATTGGNSSIYDYADTPSYDGNYGSFQVHDQSTGATIIAWNRHYDTSPETGIGSSTSGHTDWTFTGSGTSLGNTDWKLQIGVNENSSKLNINSGGTSEVKGAISNLSAFTKSGSGTLTLSGNNTYTGATTVNAGTLALTGKIYCPTSACNTERNPAAVVTITSGATLEFTNWGWLGSFGSNNYNTTYLIIDGGTLKFSGLADSSAARGFTVTSNGATFENATSGINWGLTTSAEAIYQPAWNGPVTFTGIGNITIGHVISGAGTITKSGSGTLTLSGANTYTGSTTISAGTVSVSSSANLGATPGSVDADNIIFNGGTLNTTANFTLGTNKGITLTGSGTINTNTSTTLTYGGVITGSGTFTKSGAGRLTLSGANTYSGETTLSNGTLDVFYSGGIGSGNLILNSGTTLMSSRRGDATTLSNNISLASGSIIIDISFGTSSDFILSGIISGDGKLVIIGDTSSRWIRLSGNNTFTGGVDINTSSTSSNKPILEIGSDTALGSGTVTSYGTEDYGNIRYAGSYSVANNFTTSSSTTKLNFDTNGSTGTVSGVISGAGTITKSGSGTLTLSGINTYTGSTTISVGVLKASNAAALGATSTGTTVANGAALEITTSINAEPLTLNGSGISNGGALRNISGDNSYTGLITQGSASRINSDSGTLTLDVSGNAITGTYNVTFGGAGNITVADPIATSTGTLTKDGSGTLTLSATNTYTGATTISAGILTIENNSPSLSSSSYTGAGTLIIQSSSGSFSSGITLTSSKINSSLGILTLGKSGNTASITISGDLEVAGNLTIYGPSILNGNVTTGGNQAYNGNATILATDVNISSVGSSSAGGNITFTGNIDGQTAGSNSLFILSGAGNVSVTGNVGDTTALNKLGFGGQGSTSSPVTTNLSYTGAVQSYTASATGTFTFYVWGAQGGDITSHYPITGAKGGYAYGEYNLTAGQTIYIYVGGTGADRLGNHPYAANTFVAGGWNGGGATYTAGNGTPGGGASDIRVGGTGLANRIIVAGGGGGGGWIYSSGGAGGGLNGINGTEMNGSGIGGYGGTQSAGGSVGNLSGTYKTSGSLGQGGSGSGSSAGGGGGGGGYYGGGGGGYGEGGGGGSSYIGGVSNGSTIAGNASMPNPSGGTMTGRSEDGYARIISPGGTDFTGGTQTGSFTISGNIDVAQLNTASQAFNITIGQSGASTVGSNTTFNNTGTLTLGSNAIGQSFAVTGTLTASAQSAINVAGAITSSGTQTYGALNIANNTTLTSNSGAVSLGGAVNGAAALTVRSSSNFTLSNAIGSNTALTGFTVGTSSSTNNVTISATVNVNGAITIFGNNVTLNQDLTASSGNNVIISATGDFDNNAGSDAITVSGAGRWIVYTANDNTAANFGSLNSNNSAVFGATYSSLAPASVASGNRYVFAETASAVVISFVTQNETITYGGSLDLTDNYVINYIGGEAALANVHSGSSSGGSGTTTLAAAYSSNPTISITASGSSTSTSGNIKAGSYTLAVSVSGGTLRANYSKGSDSNAGTLTVNQKALTISGITAANKTYNGNATATVDASNAVYTGLVAGDSLSVSATGTFANKNVDTRKTVTLTSSYSGDDRNNYSITDQASATANITAKALTLTGLTANNKVYNGNTVATISSYGSLSGIETGDTVTLNSSSADPDFNNKNVDTGKTVTVQSLALAGTDAGNYSIGNQTTTANITAKALTLTGLTANNKVYNGNTVATISSYGSLSGIETGDTVTLNSSSADPDFNNKNVDTGKTVTVQSLALAGTDAGNYSIGNQTTTANITAKSISSLTLSASNKTYDGNTTASVSVSSSDIVAGDTVTFSNSAVFNTRHVATGKTVTVSSISISGGTDSGNYTLATTSGSTTANITQLASVTWNGNAGDGLWSTAGNWVGSALPDQNNVAAVVIPSDQSVTFDSDTVGTIGSSITNSGSLTFNGSNNFTFGQVISGVGALTKSGSGTLTLSGINTYSGSTTISAGVLKASNAAALGATSTGTTVANGAALEITTSINAEPLTLNGSGISNGGALRNISGDNSYAGLITQASASRINSDSGTLTLNVASGDAITGTYNVTFGGSGNITVADPIATSTGTLTKDGSGTLTLSAANTYTGSTTINAGTLASTHATDTLTIFGVVTVNSGAIYQVDGTDQVGAISGSGSIVLANDQTLTTIVNSSNTFSGIISGGGNLTKSGTSTLTLSGSNTFTGRTSIAQGTLSISSDSNLGTAPGSFVSNQLSIANTMTLSLADGVTLNANRGISLASGGVTDATITNSGTSTILGVISGAALTKSGSGTLTLSGNNTYTGATTISAGTLAITHANGLGTTAGATTVSSGAALSISNNITVAEAITISGTGVSSGGALVFTSGNNTYSGDITLAASTPLIKSTAGQQIISGTINGAQALTITASDNLTLSGTIGATAPPTSLTVTTTGTGVLALNANVTTSGAQSYTAAGNITINADRILTGSIITTNSALSGAYALTITGNAVFGDGTGTDTINLSGSGKNLSVSGTATLSANITTSGTQTYTGAVTLTINTTLTGTTITTNGTIVGGGNSLTITGDAVFGDGTADTITGVSTLSVSGNTTIHTDTITTTGVQTYGDGTITTTTGQLVWTTANFANQSGTSVTGTVGGVTLTFTHSGGGNVIAQDGHVYIQNSPLGELILTFSKPVSLSDIFFNMQHKSDFGARIYNSSDVEIYNYSHWSWPNTDYWLTLNRGGAQWPHNDVQKIKFLSWRAMANDFGDVWNNTHKIKGLSFSSSTSDTITLGNNTTLTASNSQITFNGTVNSQGSETNNLNINVGSSKAEFNGVVGGTRTLGTVAITGALDLDAAIANASSLTVSTTSDLGANVTTSGTQTYTGAVTLSTNTTLVGSTVTNSSTIAGGGYSLIITGNSSIGGTISNLTSFSVSGTTSLGGSVTTTTGGQTYSGAVTLTASPTLTSPSGTILFSSTVNGANALTITNSGGSNTGDVTFAGAVGGSTALTGLAITTDVLTAAAIKSTGTLSITNTGTSSITGVVSDDATALAVTKAGTGTLTLSATNTYTGATTINAGTLKLGDGASATGSLTTSGITNNATLVYDSSADQTVSYNIGGTGVVEVIGRSRTLSFAGNTYLTTSAQTLLSSTSVIEAMYRLAGANMNGGAISVGQTPAGIYNALFDSSTNTATFQTQLYDGNFTKVIFVKLQQSGNDVQALSYAGRGSYHTVYVSDSSGTGTTLGNDFTTATITGSTNLSGGVATSSSSGGYGVQDFQITSKVIFTGTNTYTGTTTLTNTVTARNSGGAGATSNAYRSQTARGTIQLGSGSTTGSLASTAISNAGLLILNRSDSSANISSNISGAGHLIQIGTGGYILSGTNTYTGSTTISSGVLKASNAAALGATSTGTTVANGAALEITASINAEPLTLNGSGISNGGALRNISGDNSYTGLITQASNSRINSDSGTLTLDVSGNAITGTYNLTFGGAGNITVVDPIATSTGTLTKDGSGTLTLSARNEYTGSTTIADGIVKVAISSTGSITNGAFGTGAVTVNSGGAIDLNSYTLANALSLSGTGYSSSGALYNSHATSGATASGNITLAGATTIKNSTGSGTFTLSGTINGAQALTITNTTGGITFNGAVGNTTPLTSLSISGASILGANVTTSGTQTYTGDVLINADVTIDTLGGNLLITGNITTTSTTGIIEFLRSGAYKVNGVQATATSSATSVGGGSITYASDVYTWTKPTTLTSTKLLVVAGGGGGGGSYVGGGGGAGGVIQNDSYSLTSNNYSISIGGGGVGGGHFEKGTSGNNTIFGSLTAIGGGGGGACNCGSGGNRDGINGGSGGGASFFDGTPGNGTTGQGNRGAFTTGGRNRGGGGGGAGGEGGQLNSEGTNGGIGIQSTISGETRWYAGGGGAGTDGDAGQLYGGSIGGSGVGGTGGAAQRNGSNATANTGSGGGGGGGHANLSGGSGSDGIVIINYNNSVVAGLTINTGAGQASLQGNVSNLSNLTINSNSSSSQISGVISGTGALTKIGSGILTLSGTNTFIGSTTISAGTLTVSGALADTTAVTVNSGTTYNVNATDTIGSLAGAGTVQTNGTVTLTSGGDNTSTTFSGVIQNGTGTLSLAKSGSGTLTLSGNNSYTGATTISSGTLAITHANGLGTTAGATTVSSGAALSISNNITVAEAITISGTGVSSGGALVFTSGNNTYSGNITLGANSTIISNAGNQTISAKINGAYTLGITAGGNWTQSGIVGADIAPTSYTISAGSNNIILSANHTVAGDISILAPQISGDVTITSGVSLTATGNSRTIVVAAGRNFINNSGSSALVASGTGSRWIVYTANDNTTANFGSLNSNNTPIWNSTYSTLAPASVDSGSRYVFAETSTQTVTFTTTSETIIYGDSLNLSDNYSLTTSGVAGLTNVYNATASGVAINLSTVYSLNPTISISATGASTSTSGNTKVGSYTLAISLSGGTINSGYITATSGIGTLTVNQKNISTLTLSASNKTYNGDRATSATISSSDIKTNDVVTFVNSALFNNKNVGNGKTVTVSSISISGGDDSANYNLVTTSGTTTANIAAKPLTLSGLTADNKVYDGGTVATISSYGSLSGIIGEEIVTLVSAAADPDFDNKNFGTGKTVTVQSLALAGTDAGNYSIGNQTTTANISKKAVTASVSAADKVYDGNATATVTITYSGLVGSETLTTGSSSATFFNENVATEKTVRVNAITLGDGANGGLAANYSITPGQTTTAAITKKALTTTLTGTVSKTYNGNTSATLGTSNYSISGFVGSEGAAITQTSGNYNNKNFGTSKAVTVLVSASDYSATGSTSLNNYTLDTGLISGNIGTISKKNVTLTAPTVTKTYDGTVAHTVTTANLNDLSAQLQSGDVVTIATIAYANKNIGTGKTLILSAATIDDGNGGGNYSVTLANSSSGVINKAPLSVMAIDNAKFVTQSDPTFTFVYNGFVNGETASTLANAGEFTIGSVSRSNSSINAAGSYSQVLVPAGFSSNNYNISTVRGDFTIVPADQLIFAITAGSNVTYGNNPVYNNSSGTHSYSARYLKSSNNEIVNLTANVEVTGSRIVINDGAGTRAEFDINAKNGTLSTANKLKVGGYNLTATNSSITGGNFNALFAVGSLTVDPIRIDVTNNSHLSVTNVSKTYDGTATISSAPITLDASTTIIKSGDLVTVSGTGSYNNRHVGTSKAVTIDVALSGADAGNYALIDNTGNPNTRITGNVGTITQLSSVTWTGPSSGGQWSNATNWNAGAIPDQSNVALAIIPTGFSVIYNSDVVGQVSNTTIRNLGVLELNGNNNFNLNSIVTGSGSITYSGNGVLTISGNNTYSGGLNITSKEVILSNANALGTLNSITSNSGIISVSAGTILPSLTVTGSVTIKTDITTTGAQIYNNDVIIHSDNNLETIAYDNFTQTGNNGEISKTTLSHGDANYISKDWKILSTSNANITFNGKLKAASGSKNNKTSLVLKTCSSGICTGGQVTFADKVGFEFIDKDMEATSSDRQLSGMYSNLVGYNKDNFYRLDVNAQTININSNIMTWEEQIFRGPVKVGGNNLNKIKYLVSVDPAVTFLSTVSDSGNAEHSLVVRAIKLPDTSSVPKINFNTNNIGNLALFDPYALELHRDSNLRTTRIGDFGSLGINSGTVAGYSPVGGVRNSTYIIRNSPAPIVNSSANTRAADVIKSLINVGNRGNILDFFKNFQTNNTGGGSVIVRSIQIFTGSDIETNIKSATTISQEIIPQKILPSKQQKSDDTKTKQDAAPKKENDNKPKKENDNKKGGTQCSADGADNTAECKDL